MSTGHPRRHNEVARLVHLEAGRYTPSARTLPQTRAQRARSRSLVEAGSGKAVGFGGGSGLQGDVEGGEHEGGRRLRVERGSRNCEVATLRVRNPTSRRRRRQQRRAGDGRK